ncbi:MAG: SDR family NAD(P)-dependent oxidoreductase [Gammaproteobacteria bacterium]|nr:SDR family NAD(P)-dependent oxidoreductase [Gammaproteobacteria bacterium]MCW5584482.1 SDR family NAD(P)-dependent oxidoreductase [Gammaproteobacteria bacterium]
MILRDKIVLITGASSGIGAACAEQFAKMGAKLLLCARRVEVLNELAASLHHQYGVEVYSFKLDIRHYTEVAGALRELPAAWKSVDILVNNAGLAAGLDTLQEGSLQDWEDMIDTNVKGLLYVTKEILHYMVKQNAGHIINIGSIAGHYVYPKGAVYCATKYAVNALTNGLRMDLFGKKIRVSTVDPGAVETNFSLIRFKGDIERAAAVYEGMEALTPNDVADAVLYCVTRPPHVNISEIIIMPTDQAAVGMISRKPTLEC